MCNRYRPARAEVIEAQWQLKPPRSWKLGIGPWGDGPFIRARTSEPELVVGTWALIGDQDKKPINKPRMTNNARIESIASLRTYKGPWERGQRCLIPAESYDEPCWELARNEWWSFRRKDGAPWHLAGIWNSWTDPATGEVFESYSALTMNCDAHPLLRRFHKPEPTLPPDQQDKRTVIPLEVSSFRAWLTGPVEEALSLVQLPALELFEAGPAQVMPGSSLPLAS